MTNHLNPKPIRANLLAVTADKIANALFYALCYDDRGKPRRGGGDIMAGITADRRVKRLCRAGFVVMKACPVSVHSTG